MPPSASPAPVRRRTRLVVGAVTAAVVVLVSAGQPSAAPARPAAAPVSCKGTGSTATKDVAYKQVAGVDPNLLSLDYYKPTRPAGCGPAPIVIYVHGGGLARGDKSNKIQDKVDLFTGEGWVFASVNYRLSKPTPPGAPHVVYPTHAQDVVAAVAWLKDHSAQLGGDPSRIFLVGHSSGAFLVSLLSTDTSFLATDGVTTDNVPCTVSLDTEYNVTNQVAQGGNQEALYRNAFGDNPAAWAAGSPANHTAPGNVRPKFLIYAQGLDRRIQQAQDFTESLLAGGTPASFIDVRPLSHEGINDAVGAPGDTRVTPPLMSFLRSCADRDATTTDRSWALAAYADFLNRTPSAVELDATVARLDSGVSRPTVAGELTASDEWVGRIVTGFYRDTLGRDPDAVGLGFWVDRIRSGRSTVAAVAAQFYASSEYYGGIGGRTDSSWVTDLYRKVLHRDPDGAGLAYWVGRTSSQGRGDVAAAFYGSLEARRDRVDGLYVALLGRPADPAGLSYWAARLAQEDDLALAVHLAASAEYDQRAQTRFP